MRCDEFESAFVAMVLSRAGYTDEMIRHAVICRACRRQVYEEHKQKKIMLCQIGQTIDRDLCDFVFAVGNRIK